MFDLWRFGLDVQQVMTARVLRMMAGELEPIPVMWKRILHVGNNWSILVR
jgi:hypothetical protein